MPDDLYHRDILAWSEQQSARLRRVAAGERVNDVDWEHVIEEVESLGAGELRRVQSFLRLALLHACKIAAWPNHPSRRHWEEEVGNFWEQALDHFQPGMGQSLDLPRVHRRAWKQFRELRMDVSAERTLDERLVLFPEDVLDEGFDALLLLARLESKDAAD